MKPSLEHVLEKGAEKSYAPPGGKTCIYFLDDFNLPFQDEYGTQEAHELIRQHTEQGCWFDTEKMERKDIENIVYLACMNPAAGSKTINPRLQRHFAPFSLPMLSSASILAVYQVFLDAHLRRFSAECQAIAKSIVTAALDVHEAVSSNFHKSPSNFYYNWSNREIANVFKGMCMSEHKYFGDEEKLVRLWVHETDRAYGDRFTTKEDYWTFKNMVAVSAKKRFPQIGFGTIFSREETQPLCFFHYANGMDDYGYDQVSTWDVMRERIKVGVIRHNKTSRPTLDLVLFRTAMEYVIRVSRILTQRQGHAFLIGLGGSGKASVARLAASINEIPLTELVTEKVADFKDILKEIFRQGRNKKHVILVNEEYMQSGEILEILADLVNTGDIPNLFPRDEKDAIIQDVMAMAKTELRALTIDNEMSWNWFLGKVKQNVKVILCASAANKAFLHRARRFPGLISCCTIVQIRPWEKKTLVEISKLMLARKKEVEEDVEEKEAKKKKKKKVEEKGGGKVEEGEKKEEETLDEKEEDFGSYLSALGEDAMVAASVVEEFFPMTFIKTTKLAAMYSEKQRRPIYITSNTYFNMLRYFKLGIEKKIQENIDNQVRVKAGIEKLRTIKTDVDEIEENMEFLEQEANTKKKKAEEIALQVEEQKALVELATQKCNVEQEIVEDIQKDVQLKQKMCDKELKKGEPALVRSQIAISTISKKELGRCKTEKNPEKGVDTAFAAVLVLFAKVFVDEGLDDKGRPRDRSWKVCKRRLLKNVNVFCDQLKEFETKLEKLEIPEINMKEVRQYLEIESFDVDIIATKNPAAGALCSWVINIVAYYDIFMSSQPLRDSCSEAIETLNVATKKLQTRQNELGEMKLAMNQLKNDFEKAEEEMKSSQMEWTQGKTKLKLARRLARALFDEEEKWIEQSKKGKNVGEFALGDVLISSCFTSYLGPFDSMTRANFVLAEWMGFFEKYEIPVSQGAIEDPCSIFGSKVDGDIAISETLNNDRASLESAAIVNLGLERWPLLIDPQLQATHWIKVKHGPKDGDNPNDPNAPKILVLNFAQKAFMNIFTQAVEEGQVVLIESVGEQFPAAILNVLKRKLRITGKTKFVDIGEKTFEFHKDFRLYLATRLKRPKFAHDIQGALSIIDFTVTQDGLETQFLNLVVRKQRPDIGERISNNLIQSSIFKSQKHHLETDILARLASSETDVCQDREITEILERSKIALETAKEKLAIIASTANQLHEIMEKYRPVARLASLLYITLYELDRINDNYVYSLNSFVTNVVRALDLASIDAGIGGGVKSLDKKKRAVGGTVSVLPFVWTIDLLRLARLPTAANVRNPFMPSDPPSLLEDDEIEALCIAMKEKITSVIFDFCRQGLCAKDHLFLAMLFFAKIKVMEKKIDAKKLQHLMKSPAADNPSEMGLLGSWLPEDRWAKVCAVGLEFQEYRFIATHMQAENEEWFEWYHSEEPENEVFPGGEPYEDLEYIDRMLLIQAMRPSRIKKMIMAFIGSNFGEAFVKSKPFSMRRLYQSTSANTPIFFTLYPGVDPTPWIESMAEKLGFTKGNGKIVIIGMGQNSFNRVERYLELLARDGGWIYLQNLHVLSPDELERLQRMIEASISRASEDFRIFLSAESQSTLPEELLSNCIQINNENEVELSHLIKSTWGHISPTRIDEMEKAKEFKGLSYALCTFHSLLIGRKRYIPSNSDFNMQDLACSLDVIQRYLENNAKIPFDDLREIITTFYISHVGGNFFDRRVVESYLNGIFNDGIFNEKELLPNFPNPVPEMFEHADYLGYSIEHIKGSATSDLYGLPKSVGDKVLSNDIESLGEDVLQCFGGEISFENVEGRNLSIAGLINQQEEIKQKRKEEKDFGGDSDGDDDNGEEGGEEEGGESTAVTKKTNDDDDVNMLERKRESEAKKRIEAIIGKTPRQFNFEDLKITAEPALQDNARVPYVHFVMNECKLMNELIRTVKEMSEYLLLAIDGKVDKSEHLSQMIVDVADNTVPSDWKELTQNSKMNLKSWWQNVLERVGQLNEWTAEFVMPKSINLGFLFRPKQFLSALKIVTSRMEKVQLESLTYETHVTVYNDEAGIDLPPESGVYLSGLYIKGASFESPSSSDIKVVGTTSTGGFLDDATNDEVQEMPLVLLMCVRINPKWQRTGDFYERLNDDIFECPVYMDGDLIFTAQLRTMDGKHKWIQSGASILLSNDNEKEEIEIE
eukprot:g2471.t1